MDELSARSRKSVRFGECIYRRLLGSMVHECIHAICGDVTKANYGILFGLPYAVPQDVAEKVERTMRVAGEEYLKTVPVKVETEIADEWLK